MIEASHLGIPADDPINLSNGELSAMLLAALEALPDTLRPLVNEAALRLAEAPD
ncbi:hypothetical protein [Aeromonas veronii]|uniref:hypothetical protein n=1 Tax=Aeromonas veronii TaxID=654 RepID=UPI0013E90B39|nr:hypothetical protein [Aeromonas veronii]